MIKKRLFRIATLFILIPAIFLQGCMFPTQQPDAAAATDENHPEEAYVPDPPPAITPLSPGRFTLRYDSGSSLNPITTLNRDNILLASLMYESLFVLDPNLMPEPVLVESWSTENNMSFDFILKPNIAMSDGTWLTAQDAAYSIRAAARAGRFTNRFTSMSRVTATDDLTLTIELNAPNSRFIHLLDVPIIKNGTSDSRIPPGTGPFIFSEVGAIHLAAFSMHRDYLQLPITLIHLRECADTDLTELFDAGELSLLWDDPHDAFELRLNRLRETRYFETTMIQFIGFNANHIALRNPDIRRAISVGIDRQYITENIKRPGLTLPAPLALSPAFHLYDEAWEHSYFPPLEVMAVLLQRGGLNITEVYQENPFPGILDGTGGYTEFTIDFIVNIENNHKVRAAHHIANRLRRNGLNVIVRELPWNRFMNALRTGSFDMFYGETQLSADFDLSPLLLPGPLNFGRTASTQYQPFISDFLAAEGDYWIQWAAGRLVNQIEVYSPFAPILYKRHAVYSPIGAITGANPSQSSVFRNITDWSINLMMLN